MLKLGKVTETEMNELRDVYSRKIALKELLASINAVENPLYNKIISDFIDTNEKMAEWWKKTANIYQWVYGLENSWKLDFESGIVYLYDSNEAIV